MNILGISGKKQSGKGTVSNFLLGIHMRNLEIVRGNCFIDDKGKLNISDWFGDPKMCGIFDIDDPPSPAIFDFLDQHVHEFFKIYNFADRLKQDVCMNVMGLTREQCYGTDDQKNTETHLQWEDMPGVMTPDQVSELPLSKNLSVAQAEKVFGVLIKEPGPMTARDVMQYVGTNIFRKMYSNVWVDATLRYILEEPPFLAVVADCRFPNEVDAIKEVGGKVIRLTRSPYDDGHDSETQLDDYDNFDLVVDNANMNVHEANQQIALELLEWGYIPGIPTQDATVGFQEGKDLIAR
jgi:hypothetical protein